jgi:hypothetical protein
MLKSQLLASTEITAATNSSAQLLKYADNYAVQVVTSAVDTPVSASVKLQGSNDNSNWADIANTSNNITGTGNILINQQDVGYKYVRAAFAISSGSITSSVIITGKEREV